MTHKTKKSMVECYKLKYLENFAYNCRNRNGFLCAANLPSNLNLKKKKCTSNTEVVQCLSFKILKTQ